MRPVGVRLFHVDRRTDVHTDMTKLIINFCNFAKALKNSNVLPTKCINVFCALVFFQYRIT